jgi:IS30 family transposase
MIVCHLCDNPPCVRPDHLVLGTNAANSYDARQKGRIQWARGETQGHARLTAADVTRIAALRHTMTPRDIAKELGVHPETIRAVQRGKSWKHIPRDLQPYRTQREAVAKVTPAQVYAIRALQGKATQSAIAQHFGIARSAVSNIHHRKTWAHLHDDAPNKQE